MGIPSGGGDGTNLGDITYRKNLAAEGGNDHLQLMYVSEAIGSDIIKQPEDYSPPTGLGFGSWGNRYAKIGALNTATNTWSSTVNGVTHSIRFDGANWKYGLC